MGEDQGTRPCSYNPKITALQGLLTLLNQVKHSGRPRMTWPCRP